MSKHTRELSIVAAAAFVSTIGLLACNSGGGADRGEVLAVSRDHGTSTSLAHSGERSAHAVSSPMPRAEGTAYDAALTVELSEPEIENSPDLHNVLGLSANVISGGEPHSEEAFRKLKERGVRTILSVDGKVPDAELAAKYGMKYVHVPIQYKGITESEIARITKTFREQEGPFFVHCFHGKHRGPAAAGIGRLVLDEVPRELAIAEMRQWSGTSGSYEGLYETVAYGRIPSEMETRGMDWDFPAANPLDGVAGAMVQISRAADNLKAASKNGWKATEEHPDLNVVNEATRLASLIERSLELEEFLSQPADFREWMDDSKKQSVELREVLKDLEARATTNEAATQAYQALSKTCNACHTAYRN